MKLVPLTLVGVASLTSFFSAVADTPSAPETSAVSSQAQQLATIDSTRWQYNADDQVYWQVEVPYCSHPADLTYETLGIFVPAAYMNAKDNGDGTFTCSINPDAKVGKYTAKSAPIVIPLNTPGYSAMPAPTDYSREASAYTQAGFIFVNAGCRGRDQGAPTGVTDLKAAVRFLRYHQGNIPGNTDRIFTFGMSGGGAQSALMGATGDSDLYTPYLDAIGAVKGVSDAIAGAMCWCPITNLDYANEAYEWNLGSSRTNLTDEQKSLSDRMANAYGQYISTLGLTDPQGNTLVLTPSDKGIYQAGSYYDFTKAEIERSLNNFLADTTFPYTSGGFPGGMGPRGGMGGPRGGMPPRDGKGPRGGMPPRDGMMPPGNGTHPMGNLPPGQRPDGSHDGQPNHDGGFTDAQGRFQRDGIQRRHPGGPQMERKTFATVQDYIDDLNSKGVWINYDKDANKATITNVADFVAHCKPATKSIGAFDDVNCSQGENILFGYDDGQGAHFDATTASFFKGTDKESAFLADLDKTDALGNKVATRVAMYTPLYFINKAYPGYKTSKVAPFWRIRTGIAQGDTALSTEINLVLALRNLGLNVDFEMIWGVGHLPAERTGSSTENFIKWVDDCLAED